MILPPLFFRRVSGNEFNSCRTRRKEPPAANLEILRRRLDVEDGVLMANPAYRATMGFKPRFLPRLFKRSTDAPRHEGAA